MPGDQHPRRRGGQPGNTNALKHGFYARAQVTRHTVDLLELARQHGSIDDDTDLLRTAIARLVEQGDYDGKELAALARALFTAESLRLKLSPEEHAQGIGALEDVLKDVRQLEEHIHGATP